MTRSVKAEEKQRAVEVIDRLAAHMPDAKIELDYKNELQLLVAVILSAQCTDKRVNLVTPALFARFPNAAAYARVQPEALYPFIQSCGLYRSKAKNIVEAMKAIAAEHGGEVPRQRVALEALPGVGRKTAGVVLIHMNPDAHVEAFPVDTHVGRLARRLGFTRQLAPHKVEQDLMRVLPPEKWGIGHQLLVWHGRRCCYARSPECARCPVETLCPKRGVKKSHNSKLTTPKPSRSPARRERPPPAQRR